MSQETKSFPFTELCDSRLENDLNDRVERMTKMVRFIFLKVVLSIVLLPPAMAVSSINYFAGKPKNDSYFLPVQIW